MQEGDMQEGKESPMTSQSPVISAYYLGLLGITLGLFKTLRWFDDE